MDVEPHEFGGGFDQTEDLRIPVREILDIAGDIDGQIYMRDFKLIDQSDMIVSLVPELPGGVPGLSKGSNANFSTLGAHQEVYVVWKPAKVQAPLSPNRTRIFASVDEALAWFEAKGMFGTKNLFGN